jgi:hypothetical protein
MHDHRNDGAGLSSTRRAVPPPPVDRVCGLGVCDVLRVEIDGSQVESLREEIDELRRVIDEAISVATDREEAEELSRLLYESDVLAMIGRELIGGARSETMVVVGPARIISELVGGAARDAGERLVNQLGQGSRRDGASAEALVAAADLAAVWARTLVAVESVEGYSFDPTFDPVGR